LWEDWIDTSGQSTRRILASAAYPKETAMIQDVIIAGLWAAIAAARPDHVTVP